MSIHVYGDYFDRDTRAILALCDMVEVQTKFHIVDTFNGGNLEAEYVQLNETKTIPMLSQDFGDVSAKGSDPDVFYQYLKDNN